MSGLKPITVNTPTEDEAHIYAEDDAAIYQSLFGEDGASSVGQACKATVLSNNKVRVADGVICVGGHFARIPYGDYIDCEIENGQSGQNRNDIIVARFETTGTGGIDTYTCEVKKGMAGSTATDPEIVQEDLYKAGKVRELPLYRVKIEGLSITAVEQLFTLRKTNEELEKELVSLNSKMIPVFVSNPFQFVETGNKTLKYTVSGNGYAFISLSGYIGCDAGNDFGQLEAKIWDKNHILLTMDRCVEATAFNYDFGVACSAMIPVQDGDVITGTILASKIGKKTILANACCFGCQINITHD